VEKIVTNRSSTESVVINRREEFGQFATRCGKVKGGIDGMDI
jgi:hypothetical protein